MKKLLRLLALTAVVALSLCATALAADPDAPAVLVNGQAVEFADAAPQIVEGRTYIPLRATFNALGFADEDITWDAETRTATAVKDGLTITLTEGEKAVTVTRDGESETLETDAAAQSRLELLMPELMKDAGATEALKASDPMRWVGLMNACKAQAEEIILRELVYS